VGLSITLYSLVDKVGVSKIKPILYIWFMVFGTALLLLPSVFKRYRGRIAETAKIHGKYIVFIGTVSLGTYLMILFALTMAPVSYIVAVREFAVVIGAILGFVFLKEKITLQKLAAIVLIAAGMILIKAGG
jgi:uncharacterized membrane protein